MAKPTSRAELKEWCLRKLGKGVTRINVTTDQLDDRVDEAVQKFIDFHYDSTTREYWAYQLTSSDISNQYIQVPDEIQFVSKVFPFSAMGTNSIFSAEYQLTRDMILDVVNGGGGGLQYYVITQQYLSMIDKLVNGETIIDFNRHTNRVYLQTKWDRLVEGNFVLFEVYRVIDGDTFTDFWGDSWLGKYTAALIKQQWGSNLSKFRGVQLPGGIEMNGADIYQEATDEITKLEEELENKYSEPVGFIVG